MSRQVAKNTLPNQGSLWRRFLPLQQLGNGWQPSYRSMFAAWLHGIRRFLLRGLSSVQAEWALICATGALERLTALQSASGRSRSGAHRSLLSSPFPLDQSRPSSTRQDHPRRHPPDGFSRAVRVSRQAPGTVTSYPASRSAKARTIPACPAPTMAIFRTPCSSFGQSVVCVRCPPRTPSGNPCSPETDFFHKRMQKRTRGHREGEQHRRSLASGFPGLGERSRVVPR